MTLADYYFTPPELAARLNASATYVRDRLRDGAFPNALKDGSFIRIPDTDVERFIASIRMSK